MTKSEKELNKVIEFLQECEQYLHSWCCTRNGKYLPVSTQGVQTILMDFVFKGSKNPIQEFKDKVEAGDIVLSTYAFALSEDVREQLYKNHCENVKKFEKKYKI